MAVLVVLSVLQQPGRTTFDTKLDLTIDPAAFLAQALHLWDPRVDAGELQNQAYGYLFPMGPYFLLTRAIGLPTWLAQRLWCAVLLCLAFGGALLLARAMRIGTERSRLIAALGYALAPRVLTEIGPLSAEMLPQVLLPWVLLPLVQTSAHRSPRRAALLSALAVLGMGGVNGAMVVMALVLPALWLLTRRWTRAHLRLVLWWCGGVLGATLWWILPLLLLGRYSMPFLNYIESAANTTGPVSLAEALRGTDQWVAYVNTGTPWWPSGWQLVDNPVLIAVTGLVAAAGLYGLCRAGLPQRRFLVLAAVTGLTLLTIGHVGALDSPLAGEVRHLLDGSLAALRNVHKFDPVLRLPLMLAFGHALSAHRKPERYAAIGIVLVVAMAAPAWLGTLRSGTGGDEVPGYWDTAMSWLARTDPTGRTLLLPATGFGEYTWGTTDDEPAQALAASPWAVRGQVPLGSEGNTRLMDEVDAAVEDGRGAPGLAGLLARSGFQFLLLRNDIDRTSTGAPPADVLRAGLAASPGIRQVASFGPLVIYRVERSVPLATTVDERDVATVSGGPESLLTLLDDGALAPNQPTVLTGDGGSAEGPVLGTDGLRSQERNFGQVRDDLSQTLTTSEAPRLPRAATDILPFPGVGHQTVATYLGIADVTASTSASYADAVSGSDPSHQPFAALDGDPSTAWYSSSYSGPVGQWWQVDLSAPTGVDRISLSFVDDLRVGWPVTRVRITTDAGSVDRDVAPGATAQTVTTAAGHTKSVRVTVLAVAGGRQNGNVGIAEVAIPGVHAVRLLRTPDDLPASRPASFAFTRGTDPRYACQPTATGERCDAALARTGEEPDGLHRLFSTSVPAGYQLSGTVVPAPGGTNPVTPPGVQVSTSSELGGDPTAGGSSAIDGTSTTGWIADITDPYPWLRLSWSRSRKIDSIQLAPSSAGGALPTRVELITANSDQVLTPDTSGRLSFPSTRTNWLKLVVLSYSGQGPPGIGELRMSGLDSASTSFVLPCGQGPTVTIDGTRYQTSVRGTLADYLAHRPMPFTTCDAPAAGIQLGAGRHELDTGRTDAFVVQDVSLRLASAGAPTVATRSTEVTDWGTTHRTVRVGAGPAAVLTVPENANAGWVATLDGHRLTGTRVDGWQQAWLVPAGAGGTISLDFTPDTTCRAALLVGALAVLALLVAICVPVRRRGYRAAPPVNGWGVPIALIVATGALGGVAGLGLLVGWLLVRRWLRVPVASWCAALATVAIALAVAGRLLGHGQDWAQGFWAQALMLAAVAGVITGVLAMPGRSRSRPARRPRSRRRTPIR